MLPYGCTVSLQSPPSLTVLSDFFCFVFFVFFCCLFVVFLYILEHHTYVLRMYTVVFFLSFLSFFFFLSQLHHIL